MLLQLAKALEIVAFFVVVPLFLTEVAVSLERAILNGVSGCVAFRTPKLIFYFLLTFELFELLLDFC